MPVSEHFGGHGTEVMGSMKKKYGKRAKEFFYATANKRGSAKPVSNMPEHGAKGLPPHICCARAEESKKAGGFGSKHMHMGGGGY